MSSRSVRSREAKIATDRLLMSVRFFAYWKKSFVSFCFYNMQRDTCNCRAENGGPLTFNVVLISAQRKAGFVASCRRQPCVPGCFSGHCDLAWSLPALRPGMFFAGIASTDAPQCNASDLIAVFHPRKAGIATWRGLRQPCV